MDQGLTKCRDRIGLVGQKVGMSRLFTDEGETVPVTIIQVADNYVTQIKSLEVDGYSAIQLSSSGGRRSVKNMSKSFSGHLAKASVEAAIACTLREYPVELDELTQFELGGCINLGIFSIGQKVDITAVSHGKGFSGVIKRHHFSSNRASHGNSLAHNKPGSIGQNQDPGRVFPGKRMAGHLGNVSCTIQNLEIVQIDKNIRILLVRGAIPGPKGGNVMIRPAVKIRRSAR